MALFNIELFLQEGERGAYRVVAKTAYAQEEPLTQWHPNREEALEAFSVTLLNADVVGDLDLEVGKLREEVALLRTAQTPAAAVAQGVPDVPGDRPGTGKGGGSVSGRK